MPLMLMEGKMTGTFRLDARHFILDTVVGLTISSLAMLAIVGGSSPAGAVETTILTFAEDRWQPLLLILGLLSTFLAFNLALYRHLKRVYAEDKPRHRRSGQPPKP
jgi:hypothetical protein